MNARVLIVEDDESLRRMLLRRISDEYEAEAVADAEAALLRASEVAFDVLVTDVKLPRMSGIDLIPRVMRLHPHIEVIVVSGEATVDMAVEAMKRGALDFLTKPFDPNSLRSLLRVATTRQRQASRPIERPLAPTIVAASDVMRDVLRQIDTVAPFSTSVLITGETGTGKELVARRLHECSRRASRPFIALNCAAVPEPLLEDDLFGHVRGAFTGAQDVRVGRFEQADGGTLFLDEIADMGLPLQAKLLRVLQEREFQRLGSDVTTRVDVRILAATSAGLEQRMAAGAFRPDLYYRLNVVRLDVPPLRTRLVDVPAQADAFLTRFCLETGLPNKRIAPDTMAVLMTYDWPGNSRQLRNAMERAAVMSGQASTIGPEHLPEDVRWVGPKARPLTAGAVRPVVVAPTWPQEPDGRIQIDEVMRTVERRLLFDAIERAGGNKVRAARLLGIKRTTFAARLRRVQSSDA